MVVWVRKKSAMCKHTNINPHTPTHNSTSRAFGAKAAGGRGWAGGVGYGVRDRTVIDVCFSVCMLETYLLLTSTQWREKQTKALEPGDKTTIL